MNSDQSPILLLGPPQSPVLSPELRRSLEPAWLAAMKRLPLVGLDLITAEAMRLDRLSFPKDRL